MHLRHAHQAGVDPEDVDLAPEAFFAPENTRFISRLSRKSCEWSSKAIARVVVIGPRVVLNNARLARFTPARATAIALRHACPGR